MFIIMLSQGSNYLVGKLTLTMTPVSMSGPWALAKYCIMRAYHFPKLPAESLVSISPVLQETILLASSAVSNSHAVQMIIYK